MSENTLYYHTWKNIFLVCVGICVGYARPPFDKIALALAVGSGIMFEVILFTGLKHKNRGKKNERNN